jgi:hypothetical protein
MLERDVVVLGQVALVREQLQQRGARGVVEQAGVLQRVAMMRRGFAMRSHPRRLGRGERGEAKDGVGFARAGGVVRQPGQRLLAALGQPRQDGAVHRRAAHVGERVFDGAPRQLVAEHDRAVLHARDAAASRDFGRVVAGVEQRELRASGNQRCDLDDAPRLGRQLRRARQHCIAHRRRNPVLARQQLRDVKRIAAGQLVKLLRRTFPAAGQLRDRLA